MTPRLADLIRKARRLAAERDRLIEALAAEWTRALRGQNLSEADLEEFWEGLLEEAVRHAGRAASGTRTPHAWRQEAQQVIAQVRERVEAALGDH